ncbi:hypothetical protein HRI_004092300 [Hibiscus trionum]|uniref:Uncharacterized protein n=1 Tax=Hibiscus trionum TaxID=183268 RepID=A0A9W7IYD7_HIBTR|nr:hypothetical protein HRI_004092300 [Hibiscus trionum]
MVETRKRGRKPKAPASTTETMDLEYTNAAQNDGFIAKNNVVSTAAANNDVNNPPQHKGAEGDIGTLGWGIWRIRRHRKYILVMRHLVTTVAISKLSPNLSGTKKHFGFIKFISN